jgi:hypothetical protein
MWRQCDYELRLVVIQYAKRSPLETFWAKRTTLRCGLQQAMPRPLRRPASAAYFCHVEKQHPIPATPVSGIVGWTSVRASQAWNFHPDDHVLATNFASTNTLRRNEGEIAYTQSWASLFRMGRSWRGPAGERTFP